MSLEAGREGGSEGREGGRGGEGRGGGGEGGEGGEGRGDCYTYSNAPQYLNSSHVLRNNVSRHSIGSTPNNGT